MNKTFQEAMDFRHACKSFQEEKEISKENMDFILNAARLSPSSYGLEFTKYLLIKNKDLKEKIKNLAMGQEQVSINSSLLVVLVAIEDSKISSPTPKDRFNRLEVNKEIKSMFLDYYHSYVKEHLNNDEQILAWTSKQAYLAVGNIMTAAATKGIDYCAIEGFNKKEVEKLLNLDTKKYQVALLLPLGYRKNEQRESLRLPLSELVQYID